MKKNLLVIFALLSLVLLLLPIQGNVKGQVLVKGAKQIRFSNCKSNDKYVQIQYFASNFAIRPDLDFGLMAKGDTVYHDIWVINVSTQAPANLDSLTMKLKNQWFDIIDKTLPQVIPPTDSIKFQIRFIAMQDGDYLDSLGCGDGCTFTYKAQLKAQVGSPRIDVSDYDFGDVPVNQPRQATIHIKNKGVVQLIITNFSHSKLPEYSDELRPITPKSPLVLNPGQGYDFLVDFIPCDSMQYIDTLFFTSNTDKTNNVDSTAILTGKGVKFTAVSDNSSINKEIYLYPNPAENYLMIQFNNLNSENISLRIMDIYGNLVDELNSKNQNINYNTSKLANGLYIIQLNTGKKIITKTFIVLK